MRGEFIQWFMICRSYYAWKHESTLHNVCGASGPCRARDDDDDDEDDGGVFEYVSESWSSVATPWTIAIAAIGSCAAVTKF